MKRAIQIFIISLLLSQISYGQDTLLKKISFGFSASSLFSQQYRHNMDETGHFSYNIAYENKWFAGFSTGIFAAIPLKKDHVDIQFEINYDYIPNRIKYYSYSTDPGGNQAYDTADFRINTSYIQPSVVPTFIFGKKIQTILKLGFFINYHVSSKTKGYIIDNRTGYIPEADTSSPYGFNYIIEKTRTVIYDNDIKSRVHHSLGVFLGLGFSIPYKKNSFGIEIRGYLLPGEISKSQFHYLISLGLVYQLKQ
jgi:hypothetical protein